MSELPALVYTAAAVRAADRHAIEVLGIPGYTLMTRAAEAWRPYRSVAAWYLWRLLE